MGGAWSSTGRARARCGGATIAKNIDFGEFGGEKGAVPAAPLSWRDDPESSLSDHTVRLRTEQSSNQRCQESSYHCHRISLATGLRASQYFARLFRSGLSVDEPLVVEQSAYDSFGVLLDYIYGKDLALTSTNAVAMLWLSDYLGILQARRFDPPLPRSPCAAHRTRALAPCSVPSLSAPGQALSDAKHRCAATSARGTDTGGELCTACAQTDAGFHAEGHDA